MRLFVLVAAVMMAPALAWGADRDELLRQATEMGRLGRTAEGLDRVGQVLEAAPDDLEARLLEARLLAWAGRNPEAETAISRILAEFPANAEALALAGSVAWYRGDAATARERFAAALAADPDQQEAKQGLERARTAPAEKAAWRVDAGIEINTYNGGGRKGWQDGFIRIGHAWTPETQIHLFAQHSHRFGEIDRFLEAGLSHAFEPWLRGKIALGGTPAADFLPRRRVDLGGAARVANGNGILDATWLTLDLRHAAYRSGDTAYLAPGFQQYFAYGRAWATGRFLMMEDERGKHPTGWEARADWQALDGVRLFAGYADVPETSDNRSLPTTSRFAGAVLGLTADIDLTISASRIAQETLPVRHGIGASLSVRF